MKKSIFTFMVLGAGLAMSHTAQAAPGDSYCREYTKAVSVGGLPQQGYGTACMQPDGSWEMVTTENAAYNAPRPMQAVQMVHTTTPVIYTTPIHYRSHGHYRPYGYYHYPYYNRPVISLSFGKSYHHKHWKHHRGHGRDHHRGHRGHRGHRH